MSTATEMAEFVTLWEVVQDVHFSELPDQIAWKWTTNGLYSCKSAYYDIQFVGSALSTARQFGRLKPKANFTSLLGYLCKERFRQLTTYCSKEYIANQFAVCALKIWKLQLIFAYTAAMRGKCGALCTLGHRDWLASRSTTWTFKTGGTQRYRLHVQKTGVVLQHCLFTRLGIFGTKGTEEFFRVSHKLQQGFSV